MTHMQAARPGRARPLTNVWLANIRTVSIWRPAAALAASLALGACERPPATASAPASTPPASAASAPAQQAPAYAPVTVQHKLGATVLRHRPQRVVALDMNEVDFLDLLGIAVAGMPKDFVPGFLAAHKHAPDVLDTGAIVQPNLERVHAARPDLILITSLQARHYPELSEIAPTLHFDVDYRDSRVQHVEVIKEHLLTLGRIFERQALARQRVAELDAKLAQARRVTEGRTEKALIVLHNNGAFSTFGVQSRYGFVFKALGVQPAGATADTGLHGEPVSSEFIRQADPDILYVVDRTAVMEGRPPLNADTLANPLLRQTKAWKNGRVVFADGDAWYVTAASPRSVMRVIDDVIQGYADPPR